MAIGICKNSFLSVNSQIAMQIKYATSVV